MSDEINSKESMLLELAELRKQFLELKESEKRFRAIMEATTDFIFTKDLECRYTYVNRAMANLFGCRPEDIIGKTPADLFDPEYANIIDEVDKVALRGEIADQIRILRIGDQDHTFHTVQVALEKADGEVGGLCGIVRDITEQKKVEESLVQAMKEREATFDAANHAVWILDKNLHILRSNKSANRLFQSPSGDLVGKHCCEIMHGSKEPIPDCPMLRVRQSLQRESLEIQISEDWFLVTVDPILNEIGAFTGAVHIVTDITERKRTREALRHEKDKAQHYLDIARMIFLALDFSGEITLINQKGSEILGYEQEDIIGKNWFDCFLPVRIKDQVKSVFQELMTGNIEPVEYFENPVVIKGGQERIIAWYNTLLKDNNGVITGTISSGEDITERKMAEERFEKLLHDTRERVKEISGLYGVATAISEMLDTEDLCTKIAQLIPSAWQYPEITRSRVVLDGQEHVSDSFEPTEWKQSADIVVQGKVRGVVEVYYLEERPEEDEGLFLTEELDLINGIAGMLGTAIEHKQAEYEREQAYAFLQIGIDGFPEELMVIDLDYTIALANQTVRKLAGQDPVSAHLKCHHVSHKRETPCENDEHPCPLLKVVETRQPIAVEHIHEDEQGNKRTVEIVAAPIFDKQGEVIQIIESCRDITRQKQDAQIRRELEQQIQQTQKLESLGVLAGGIAHDFNNILMTILGNANLALQDLSIANPAYVNVKEIEIASKRASDLARQMLAYSGKGKFLIEKISLNDAIREMMQMLEVSISKKAVIKYHLADNLPLIEADSTQIRQIIMNLVTNASDAIDVTDGVISITTGARDCDSAYLRKIYLHESLSEGKYVYAEVTDTGSGMDKETREKLFDPFYTTKFTGRGLGLAVVLGIIRGHKGAIKVDTELGKGTSMTVLFPSCPSSCEISEPEHGRVKETWHGVGTILLVDDEESILYIVKQMLERIGFDVLTASNGREALNLFLEQSDEINMVILDLTMPHLDGEETFRELRRIRGDIRILMSSGYNELDVSQRFAGKPLVGFLQKPYVLNELRRGVRDLLEK